MILQFAAHVAVIKLTKWIVIQVIEVMATNKPPAKVQEFYNLDVSTRTTPNEEPAESNTISQSISSLSVE